MTSGGKRPGAGRKAIPTEQKRVQISITVDPLTREKWREVRRYRGAAAVRQVEGYICELFRQVHKSHKF